jgi:hypothetical protein
MRQKLGDANYVKDRGGGLALVDAALSRGVINHETAQAVRGILVLRNVAANGRVVDAAKALGYLTLADAAVFAIETWHPKVG